MKNYKELLIWQKGIEIVQEVYELAKFVPSVEKYGIVSQMTRAAISIPANIAEGSGRNTPADYARFLDMALGSAFVLETYLVIIRKMNWVTDIQAVKTDTLLQEELKMIYAFLKKIRN